MMNFFSNVRHIKGFHSLKLISEKTEDKAGGGGKPSKGGTCI